MKLDYVSIEERGGIAIVRFDRKANLNAFNEKLVVELTRAARGFFDDLETHVVILAGASNAFSAGFDLKAADSWPSETDDLVATGIARSARVRPHRGGSPSARPS